MKVRGADLAGSWYPGEESDCRRTIERFLDSELLCPDTWGDIVGGIVPHAGWVFSGKIACKVIECLSVKGGVDTCIIFGRHLHSASDNIIMKEGQWATPLGELEVDVDLAGQLTAEFPFDVETTSRYDHDNTIEVQLPLVKYFFPEIKIVPIGLPPNPASLDIAKRAVEISKGMGRKTIVLGSTDLTHYGPNYGYMPKGTGEEAVEWVKKVNDKRAVDLMVEMDENAVIDESFESHNICCSGAVAAAIAAAKELGAVKAKEMIYSNSYDLRQDSSFVGYVGIVFGCN
ncbi:MAG: AmmeMemoRadiSam system protein B [Deltaproteobacteria bacterium]|nr:AmmeMemoRadiSam system protein B [Deltaproteobacteria bacterium]